jgi:hypothetical protein
VKAAEPMHIYIALHPYDLMINAIKEATPAPKWYPEASTALAEVLYSIGKFDAIN